MVFYNRPPAFPANHAPMILWGRQKPSSAGAAPYRIYFKMRFMLSDRRTRSEQLLGAGPAYQSLNVVVDNGGGLVKLFGMGQQALRMLSRRMTCNLPAKLSLIFCALTA